MAAVDVNNIKISLENSPGKVRKAESDGMSGATAPVNVSKDINSWKDASNSDSSLHHVSKESSLYQGKLALLP
jgi:hypothetical protein